MTSAKIRVDREPLDRPRSRTDQSTPAGGRIATPAATGRRRVGPATYKTTLYQLDRVPATPDGLDRALDRKYLKQHDFIIEQREVAGAAALLVHGAVPCGRAEWCDVITALTGQNLSIGYSNAGSVLLVAIDDQVFALTYGTIGRHMVNLDLANPGFGIAFAVRSLAPNQIQRVKRQVFGLTARIDRNLVPAGQHIRQYGIDKWGEIVGQVCGKLINSPLTVSRTTTRPISITGANSLQIELGINPEDLISDLREISRVCRQQSPAPDLEFITQIRPVVASDPRLPGLNDRLDALLGADAPTEIGLAIPAHCVEAVEQATSYRVYIPYSGRRPHEPDLTLDTILDRTQRVTAGNRLQALKKGRIGVYGDSAKDELIGAAAHKWLTAELSIGAEQLLYLEGHWYQIGEKHLDFLRAEIAEILDQPPSITLPAWTPDLADEDAYNRHAAKPGGGFVLLDKHFLKTKQHSRGRGIEACDLLGPDLELIHVKRPDSSSTLSHLFLQGEVAVDALKYEDDARQALYDEVHAQYPDHRLGLDFKPWKVVYAIALKDGRKLTPENMFTFAQVALYRAVKTLRNEKVAVEVIAIPS